MTNILIIDDCAEFAETVAAMLESAGYDVTVACDVENAMEFTKSEGFDLVLCDLVMPLEEGEECAIVGVSAISKIREASPDVPVIAMSGELTGAPLNEIRQFGATSVLSKPFNRDTLLVTVEGAIQRNS